MTRFGHLISEFSRTLARLLRRGANNISYLILGRRNEARYWRDIALSEIEKNANPKALQDSATNTVKVRKHRPLSVQNKWTPTPRAKVSIVLGTYNRLNALKLTIESIRNNGFSSPYEIIVIDGGSTDGTHEWLVEQQDIILIVQHNRDSEKRRRRSWGYFINLGFKIAEARWILMISDDCLLAPGSIAASLQQADELEAHGRKIGGIAFYFRNWPKDDRYFVQHTIGGMLMVNHGLFLRDALADVNYANEDDYSFYKADSDLSLKLWSADYEIAECPSAIVEHLFLPSEQLRMLNTSKMDSDRAALHERWKGIYSHTEIEGFFKPPVQRFIDKQLPEPIAERFRPLLEEDQRNLSKT